jgi:phospholipid/cholesterol/gamma-HCH transport system substrate-binding protein
METRASYVMIGAFTLGVLVLAVVFVLWLGKSALDRDYDQYDIVFSEAVTGLSAGGAVQYNGIQVGEVRKLSLAPGDPSRVVAHVRVDGNTPVKQDTTARLTFTGLTGVALIQLAGGTTEAPMLEARPGQTWPTIAADDSALQKLMVSGEDIVTNVNELLLRVSNLLSAENLQNVDTTLSNIERLTGDIAARGGQLGEALDNLAAASDALKRTMASADTLLERDATQSLEEMRESLAAVRHLAESVDAALAANRGALDRFGNDGLTQVAPLLAEMRSALQRLEAVTAEVERDPVRFMLGRDGPRERDLR